MGVSERLIELIKSRNLFTPFNSFERISNGGQTRANSYRYITAKLYDKLDNISIGLNRLSLSLRDKEVIHGCVQYGDIPFFLSRIDFQPTFDRSFFEYRYRQRYRIQDSRKTIAILTYCYAIKFFNPAFPKFETGARGFHVPSSRDIQTART